MVSLLTNSRLLRLTLAVTLLAGLAGSIASPSFASEHTICRPAHEDTQPDDWTIITLENVSPVITVVVRYKFYIKPFRTRQPVRAEPNYQELCYRAVPRKRPM
jgi:hypothetical protein